MSQQPPILLVSLQYKNHVDGGLSKIRLTNAPFDVKHDNAVWSAAGDLLSIGDHESTYELVTEGIEIHLSGVDKVYQTIIDQHGFRKAPVDVFMATLAEGTNEVSSAKYYHRGFALTPVTEFDESSGTISVIFETESAFRDLDKKSHLMTSSLAHHNSLHPNDKFFQYTADTSIGEEVWRD